MTDVRDRHRKEDAVRRRVVLAFALTLAGPLAALAAVVGLRLGWWPYGVAWNVVTVMVALPLTAIGAVAALFAVVAGVKTPRVAGVAALASVVVSGATLFAFARVLLIQSHIAAPDISTNPQDPPGFPAAMIALGAPAGAPPVAGNCAVEAFPSQSAPGAAGYALQTAGFDIRDLGVGRGLGTRSGVWFGTTWDAVIRIRPGRTDIRVSARRPDQDRGEACRLAIRIAEALKP